MRRLHLLPQLVATSLVLPSIVGGCATSCPAALLPGVLVANGAELMIREESGFVRPVTWPWGYSVRSDDRKHLVVSDVFGTVKAVEGDEVELPGGEAFSDGPWRVCGEMNP